MQEGGREKADGEMHVVLEWHGQEGEELQEGGEGEEDDEEEELLNYGYCDCVGYGRTRGRRGRRRTPFWRRAKTKRASVAWEV
eukprot:2849078-Pyramimonas_sp.AAC.2